MLLIKFAAMYAWQTPGSHTPVVAIDQAMLRLAYAAALGGILGLEREVRRKAAGLRTNMFMCVGAALFTIVSNQLAVAWGGEPTRVASYVVAGIGFIGGGAILHSEGSVRGLTTAATLFVGSAIGMAAGGGFYAEAGFATGVVLAALYMLGMVERRFSLKKIRLCYEAKGPDARALMDGINLALEKDHKMMQNEQVVEAGNHTRVQFVIDGTRALHRDLLIRLRQAPGASAVECLGAADEE